MEIRILRPWSSERRIDWLLQFLERDAAEIAKAEWDELCGALNRIIGRAIQRPAGRGYWRPWPWPRADQPTARLVAEVIEAQRQLRECLFLVSRGQFYSGPPAEVSWLVLPLADDKNRRTRRPGRKAEGRGPHVRLGLEARGPLPVALVLAAVDLLNDVGADRLRACPLPLGEEEQQTPCGRLFLARRRQLYCTIPHARMAAWRRWAATHRKKREPGDGHEVHAGVAGGPRAKK